MIYFELNQENVLLPLLFDGQYKVWILALLGNYSKRHPTSLKHVYEKFIVAVGQNLMQRGK